MNIRTAAVAAVSAAFLVAFPATVTAQGGKGQQQAQKQQQMMQQQMQHMQQMRQHARQLQDRCTQMDRQLEQQMDRLRDRSMDQDRLQDRLRQHQQLRDMTQSTGDMLRHMNRNGERLRMMMGDRAFQGDQQMQRHMEQLQNRWREMLENADESVQIMERIRNRLGQGQGQ
ncbi:MAG: hypothetical protein Q8W44_13740 [Candidatus Palauibacterales bacterium]|nr:hypothetical protein [Candidatus Palauibacterales bacterium]